MNIQQSFKVNSLFIKRIEDEHVSQNYKSGTIGEWKISFDCNLIYKNNHIYSEVSDN